MQFFDPGVVPNPPEVTDHCATDDKQWLTIEIRNLCRKRNRLKTSALKTSNLLTLKNTNT